jgi:molecular chaperone HscC
MSGQFSPVIERNTVVPASREARFYPTETHQTAVTLRIFQGESPRTANNVFLGQIDLPLPAGKKSHENPVDVRFTYDVNGLLEVDACAVASGVRRSIVIQQNPGLLSADEIRGRLKALASIKVHPRDDQANLALLSRGERLYEEHVGEIRQRIGHELVVFRSQLERQDPKVADRARKHLTAVLDDIETDIFA